MLDGKLEPNVVSYNASISASEKGSQWGQALVLLREMMFDRRLESDVVSYNASISASEKGSQWGQALVLLREISGRRCGTKVVPEDGFISSCEWCMQKITVFLRTDVHHLVCITNRLH